MALADGGQVASILEPGLEMPSGEKGHSASWPRGGEKMLPVPSTSLGTDMPFLYPLTPWQAEQG